MQQYIYILSKIIMFMKRGLRQLITKIEEELEKSNYKIIQEILDEKENVLYLKVDEINEDGKMLDINAIQTNTYHVKYITVPMLNTKSCNEFAFTGLVHSEIAYQKVGDNYYTFSVLIVDNKVQDRIVVIP